MTKATKTTETVAIPLDTFLHIKQALSVIEELDELQCWGLTPSMGYLHIAADLARDLSKQIENIKV
jgi:hypothetical protein